MDKKFMSAALSLAREAAMNNEIPVGAVVVKNNEIIGRGRNRREETHDPTSHAEIEAIRDAAKNLGTWKLDGCSLYVTLEPCVMCTGAIINARISELVFGAFDLSAGCADSAANLFSLPFSNGCKIFGGIAEEESKSLITDFFKDLRKPN